MLALIMVVVLGFKHCPGSTSQPTITMKTPAPSPTHASSSTRVNKRLVLENNPLDHDARVAAFKQIVISAGEHCDGIEKPAMRSPGNWIVTCKPGYIYTFKFDAQGNLTEVKKMN
ncbi:MAG: hypothetical protein JXO72_14830 [Vicinamibacteria bacterium]|nr:hypothetical protein [Vicinamibacteria bacterium]